MSTNTTLLQLIDLVQAELPTIARQVLESTGQALKANPRHFGLLEPWARRRSRFAMEFETDRVGRRVRSRLVTCDQTAIRRPAARCRAR